MKIEIDADRARDLAKYLVDKINEYMEEKGVTLKYADIILALHLVVNAIYEAEVEKRR